MTTIAARVQKSLTTKIVKGELRPGYKLDEKALASEFGVSRTPIREALRELGARGLIELVPHRGGIVAQISIDQLADMLDAECEIEALCARLAAQRMTAVEKGALQECHNQAKELTREKDETRYLVINQTFHDMICDGAHNATLTTMARELRTRLAPFRQSQSGERRLSRSHEEHAKIVDAILSDNQDAAYNAMRLHNARLSSGILGLLRSGK
ncbi:GntR family transcriptional regulator [Rhodoplanes sp. Z2-YC6860]|uniref:GntR family transcriptional regulator n=1 Tax=Rhodoplanes sp. Z2-YC6860 TaxID=674703 RepID=UPI00078B3D1E|nr:GntR family transcriptional regulator [Rhodoplanes sp. Z2-YC6860]AMN44362.1 GntR family transcriptional regulator [Rhodoplanes sp. Z2-YC6860]